MNEFELILDEEEKLMVNDEYSYQKIRNDLSKNFKFKFFRDIFRRHFDDYIGRKDALKRYIIVEIFGMMIFVIIGLIMMIAFIYMRYNVNPFNVNKYMSYLADVFIYASIFVTVFIFLLVLYNILRITKHRNIYGILFGLKTGNYLIHRLQYTYVKNDSNIIMPIYFTINIDQTDFDQIIFDNKNILNKQLIDQIMDDQYDSNERFINMMHYVLIESKYKKFNDQFKYLSAYKSLEQATKGTMLK